MNIRPAARKATSRSIAPDLVEEAKSLGINASRAAEAGLGAAVRAARAHAWRREKAEAIASWNAWVAEHGLPLATCRQF